MNPWQGRIYFQLVIPKSIFLFLKNSGLILSFLRPFTSGISYRKKLKKLKILDKILHSTKAAASYIRKYSFYKEVKHTGESGFNFIKKSIIIFYYTKKSNLFGENRANFNLKVKNQFF